MNTTTLQTKLDNAEAKVEKTSKTIERHEKQLQKKLDFLASKGINVDLEDVDASRWINGERHEFSWEVAEIGMKLEDIKGAKKKHEEAKNIAMNWEAKLAKEKNQVAFLEENTPQVIKDFLDEWAVKATDWHIQKFEAYQEFKVKLKNKVAQAEKDLGIDSIRRATREQENELKELGLDYRSIQARKVNFAGLTVLEMDSIRDESERLLYLDKEILREKKAKTVDLVTRIHNVVGTITDAKSLSVSDAGNLNGFIIGTKGKASVNTFGAGGYNIQCFHYRTTIKEIK